MKKNSGTGHFPLEVMLGDFLIAGFATLVGGGLLLGTNVSTGWRVAFALFLVAALWFLWRTWRLYRLEVEVHASTTTWNGNTQNLADIKKLHLRFYGSVRQRKNGAGTFQLTLDFADGSRFQADQRLTNFQEVLEAAGAVKPACDDISKGYLASHGISL